MYQLNLDHPRVQDGNFDLNLLLEGGAYLLSTWSNPHPIPAFPQLGWVGHTIDRCIMSTAIIMMMSINPFTQHYSRVVYNLATQFHYSF